MRGATDLIKPKNVTTLFFFFFLIATMEVISIHWILRIWRLNRGDTLDIFLFLSKVELVNSVYFESNLQNCGQAFKFYMKNAFKY